MAKNKKKGNNIIAYVLFALIVIGLICFIVFRNKDDKNVKSTKDALEKETVIERDSVFYLNKDKKAYLKFYEGGAYEYTYYNSKGKIEKETGSYVIDEGGLSATIGYETKAEVMGDFVEIKPIKEKNKNKYKYQNYVDANKMEALYKKIEKKVVAQTKELENNKKNAKTESVDVNIKECYRYKDGINMTYENELICIIDRDIYLEGYKKSKCKIDEDNKFGNYANGNGTCEKDHVASTGYYKFDLINDYDLLVVYAQL